MPRGTISRGAFYLYAVVPASGENDIEAKGIYDTDVFTVAEGELAAVVSEVPDDKKLRPERRHIAAHQGVLKELISRENVVLPVSFGTVADTSKGVHKLLTQYSKGFHTQIERVRGKVEMELRVTLDVPNAFEYFVSSHEELREMRDRVFDHKHEPTREEKIDLGQLFERLLEEDRERYTKKVEEALSSCAVEIKRNKCRNEREMMRLSVLIEKGAESEFERAVNEAAKSFNDSFVFEYDGPVPPYSFVDLRIKI